MIGSPKGDRRGRRCVALFAAAFVLSGCYTYHPVGTVSIGDRVQAQLTTEEAIKQSEVGGEPLRDLEGTVLGVSEDNIRMQVVTARSQSIQTDYRFTRDYTVPRAGIVQLNERRLSPIRTAGVTALIGGLVYLILDTTVIGGGGSDPGGIVEPASPITHVRFRIP